MRYIVDLFLLKKFLLISEVKNFEYFSFIFFFKWLIDFLSLIIVLGDFKFKIFFLDLMLLRCRWLVVLYYIVFIINIIKFLSVWFFCGNSFNV